MVVSCPNTGKTACQTEWGDRLRAGTEEFPSRFKSERGLFISILNFNYFILALMPIFYLRATRKWRVEEMKWDYMESNKKKFEEEKSKYIEEIENLMEKLEEVHEISLEYIEQKEKLKELYDAGIIGENLKIIKDRSN